MIDGECGKNINYELVNVKETDYDKAALLLLSLYAFIDLALLVKWYLACL